MSRRWWLSARSWTRPAPALRHLLVHCHAGISRSTAALATLLARHTPLGDEAGIFARIREIRPIAWPNSRMIGFADDILGRGGRLNAALRDHYRLQAPERPEFMAELRRNGRGAEIPGRLAGPMCPQ